MAARNNFSNQNIQVGSITVKDGSSLTINQIADHSEKNLIINNRGDFVNELDRIIAELSRVKNTPEITEAVNELSLARQESEKSKPSPEAMKRYINSARGVLYEIATFVAAAGTAVSGINALATFIKPIFGG